MECSRQYPPGCGAVVADRDLFYKRLYRRLDFQTLQKVLICATEPMNCCSVRLGPEIFLPRDVKSVFYFFEP